MMDEDQERCTSCRFYTASRVGTIGLCRRYPQSVVIREAAGGWCGEYFGRKGAPKTAEVSKLSDARAGRSQVGGRRAAAK